MSPQVRIPAPERERIGKRVALFIDRSAKHFGSGELRYLKDKLAREITRGNAAS